MTRKADGIRRRWCKSSRPASGRALMGHKAQSEKQEGHEMKKLTAHEVKDFLDYERHVLRKLRREMEYTRNPDAVQRYIDFTRLSIICAKRGYMYSA